jgi:nucleoside-diphosphate-sugar epimerase
MWAASDDASFKVNVTGTINVINACKAAGVKRVQSSTFPQYLDPYPSHSHVYYTPPLYAWNTKYSIKNQSAHDLTIN